MKNKILKIMLILILFIGMLLITKSVQANSISSINMDIYVDNNGTATVTETWVCSVNQGTESYHPYYNLGNSKIINLTVSDETKMYTTLSSWDTEGTLNSKAYKCGINKISNGIEICWGISSYGTHTYKVKYNITNFVSQLNDSQMAYWTLIPYDFSTSIGNVEIKIYTDSYLQDTIDVWGYGKYGALCYVSDGAIYMNSDGRLGSNEYITILAKFPNETFNATNKLNKDFDYYYKMSQEGSKKYNKRKTSIIAIILPMLEVVFPFIIFIVVTILGSIGTHKRKYGIKYGPYGKTIPRDIGYYRDIPCSGDIFKAYYIAYQYKLVKKETDILGAIILKWLKQGIIKTENKEGGKIFKKENTVIILGEKDIELDNYLELQIYEMMYEASEDGILENKEFEIWCKRSYQKILGWFDKIQKTERDNLATEGLLTKQEASPAFLTKYIATQELKEEAMRLAGLRKYLLDYTLIKDREAIEVELFENYLIFAQIFGIADKVSKQFKELYPDLIEQTNFNSYDNLVYINYCTTRGISSANSAQTAARAAASGYSSGGGGFSSGGGGGGSFGGGGGRRRLPLK